MKKKVAITILVALILCVIGIIVYQNANKELLIGCYYNYDEKYNVSYLEIREDGTFEFLVSEDTSSTVKGTYEIDDKYLFLTTTYNEEIKFEIGYKKLYIVNSEVFPSLLLKGKKYKWSEGTIISLYEQYYSE